MGNKVLLMMLSRLAVEITLLLVLLLLLPVEKKQCCTAVVLVTIASVTHRTGSVFYNDIHTTDG